MTDNRDEPVEDDKEDAQIEDRVSHGGGNYRLMRLHFVKQQMEAPAADVLLTREGYYLVAVKTRQCT